MRELVFFPTPNWFISRPIDINKSNGSLAITAINSIILTNNLFDEYNFTIREAHTKRLHAVSFGPENYSNLLASCSEDFDVKVWNLNTRALHLQYKLHQSSVTCIDWLCSSSETNNPPLVLISCDIKGNIYKYNLSSGEHTRYYPESNKVITQLNAQHPGSQPIAAVGYKHGTILILDLGASQLRILHKLKSHEDAISGLSWRTSDSLVSSAEDRCVRVWRLVGLDAASKSTKEDSSATNGGGVEELKCLKVPGSTMIPSSNNGGPRQQSTICYTPLCVPRPGLLLTASFKGELFYYDLEKSLEQHASESVKWCPFVSSTGENQNHKKAIFDILSYKDKVITLSLDRLINIWDLNTFKQESSIASVNGFIYSISSSPIDPTLFAISVGDSSIKLLSEKQDLKCTKSFSYNIRTEVTQVSWHPSKENVVAFGTKEGKVGLADIMANNKPAHYIYTNYNQSVYTLIWSEPLIQVQVEPSSKTASKAAPAVATTATNKKHYFLYSVADAKIIQHQVQFTGGGSICGPNTQSTNFYKELTKLLGGQAAGEGEEKENDKPNTFEQGLTELAVFGKYFAIGKYDGSVEIYQREPVLVQLATFYNHQKLVTCIRWNSSSSLVASGSNDFNIIVIDFGKFISNEPQPNQKLFAQFKHKLVGHKERITCLNWSLIDSSLLVSCSYDSTCQVWNGDLGTPIANFRGHSDKLLCCMFSSIDPNSVFSGGEDYCLLRWKIDSQVNKTPPNESPIFTGKKKGKMVKKQEKKFQAASALESVKPKPVKQFRKETSESEIDLDEKAEPVAPPTTPYQQEKTIKIDTQVDTKKQQQQQNVECGEVKAIRRPIKSGSPSQRDLKTLFVLSSSVGGLKPNVKKLNDCMKLFEVLYEKQEQLRNSKNWDGRN